jgi:hypothetical protein
MEEIGDFRGKQSLEAQAPEQVGLGFFAWLKQSSLRGDQLRKKFAELPKLDEARVRVIVKIAFRKRPQTHELDIVLFEKGKIARTWLHNELIPQAGSWLVAPGV